MLSDHDLQDLATRAIELATRAYLEAAARLYPASAESIAPPPVEGVFNALYARHLHEGSMLGMRSTRDGREG